MFEQMGLACARRPCQEQASVLLHELGHSLVAIAQGASPDELADELAAAVLDDELVRLALAVAAGGDHRWRRAIELAGAVLALECESNRRMTRDRDGRAHAPET